MRVPLCSLAGLLFLLSPRPLPAQQPEPSPAITEFARELMGSTWNLRGTFSLSRLRFDGEAMRPVRRDGTNGSPYETFFVDEGVVRMIFPDKTTSWLFFGENLDFVTSVKVRSERRFALPQGATAKGAVQFPEDLAGVVFESSDPESGNPPGKIRWNGKDLEVGAFRGGAWTKEKVSPVVAGRRLFEVQASETATLWFVFDADGTEAWLLEVENIFGGHRSDRPAVEAVAEAQSGLSPQLNDLANHLMDLIDAGETERVRTLQRQFARKLAGQPELLERLKLRVKAR